MGLFSIGFSLSKNRLSQATLGQSDLSVNLDINNTPIISVLILAVGYCLQDVIKNYLCLLCGS